MVARKRSTAVRSFSGSGDCAASPAAGVAAAMVAADAALPIMPNAAAPPFRTVRRSKAFRSIVFLLFRDDCRLSLRPKSVGYGISLEEAALCVLGSAGNCTIDFTRIV